MKITKLETFIVPPRWCFLKIETDEGIVGWGEPVVEGRAHTVAAAVEELSDYLIGKDPLLIEDHWQVMYRSGFYRGGPITMSAIAGVDQALWDIKGKHHGVPIHALLGGQVRDKIKVYSWIGGDRPSDVANNARAVVERGFKAVKMNGSEELQIIDTFDKVQGVINNVAAVREAVGPNIGIGVDFHGRVHKPMAKVLAKELDPYKLLFIEEPVLSETRKPCVTSSTRPTRRSLWANVCIRAGTSSTSCQAATSTSSSRTRRTRAGSPSAARSRRWPKRTTLRSRCTAHSVRLLWRPACRSTR
jgi:galactonate dehydratase